MAFGLTTAIGTLKQFLRTNSALYEYAILSTTKTSKKLGTTMTAQAWVTCLCRQIASLRINTNNNCSILDKSGKSKTSYNYYIYWKKKGILRTRRKNSFLVISKSSLSSLSTLKPSTQRTCPISRGHFSTQTTTKFCKGQLDCVTFVLFRLWCFYALYMYSVHECHTYFICIVC